MIFSFIVGMKLPTRSRDDNGRKKCAESRAVLLTNVITARRDLCLFLHLPVAKGESVPILMRRGRLPAMA